MRMLKSAIGPFLLTILVSGCGTSTSQDAPTPRDKRLIGVSLLTQTHAFYKDLENSLRAEASLNGFTLSIVSCEMDPIRQAAQLEDFITQRVDAILAAPCDSSAVVPYLERAADAKIPVFTVDIAARGGKVVAHVASDNEAGGRLAGRTLAQLIGGKGEVVIIDHPEVASVQDRTRGFREALQDFPGVKIVQAPSASGQRARAMTAMEDMIQAHPGVRGVFGINDDSALGALSVIEASNRKDIAIVGFDATEEARAAIKRGSALRADIAQHPDEIGKAAIRAIAAHFKGQQPVALVAVPVTLVDATTLK